jgi:hypothetical protein
MDSFLWDISMNTIFRKLSSAKEEDKEGAVAVGMDIADDAINIVVIKVLGVNVIIGLSSFAFRPCIVKSQ